MGACRKDAVDGSEGEEAERDQSTNQSIKTLAVGCMSKGRSGGRGEED